MTLIAIIASILAATPANTCSTAMRLDGVLVTSCGGRVALRSDGVTARRYYANGEVTQTDLATGDTVMVLDATR